MTPEEKVEERSSRSRLWKPGLPPGHVRDGVHGPSGAVRLFLKPRCARAHREVRASRAISGWRGHPAQRQRGCAVNASTLATGHARRVPIDPPPPRSTSRHRRQRQVCNHALLLACQMHSTNISSGGHADNYRCANKPTVPPTETSYDRSHVCTPCTTQRNHARR